LKNFLVFRLNKAYGKSRLLLKWHTCPQSTAKIRPGLLGQQSKRGVTDFLIQQKKPRKAAETGATVRRGSIAAWVVALARRTGTKRFRCA